MRIKNINIENFNPLICVPIVDTTIDAGLNTAKNLTDNGVKIIEWRLDYLKELDNIRAIGEGLDKMASICNYTILIATIRSKKEGGNALFDEEKMKSYLTFIAKSGTCDFIDVEYYTYVNPRELVSSLKKIGQNVICSHHDFVETPENDTVFNLLEEMDCSECDVVKMAVMPQTTTDVTRFMDISNAFAKETDKLVVTMSMGKLGKVSRYAGDVTGSCITFGSYGKESAPGQIEYKKLRDIIDRE